MSTARAFTLIELLVVIAIIGILSSVVLASLNTARTKSRDATVQADMSGLVSQAAIYEDSNQTYGDTAGASDCTVGVFSDSNVQSILSAVDELNNAGGKACYATGGGFAVAVARPSSDTYTPATTYWCVDASRKCGVNDLADASSGSCNCP